jgi:hypothetical protein
MPYFMHLAEKSLKADAKQILFRNIQRKGYYSLPPDGKFFIYADYADLANDTLFGIVGIQYDNGRVKRITTSEITKVQFDPHDKFNEVQLTVYGARQIGDAANDYWGQIGSLLLKKEFGSLLGDKIKFKKVEEMKRIDANLMLFDPVAKIARTAYVQLATEMLARDMDETLKAPRDSFYEFRGSPHSVRLSATACALDKPLVLTLKPPVIVEEYDNQTGRRLRRLGCEKAEIYVEEDPANPKLGLDLHSARDEEGGSLLVQYVVPDLTLPDKIRRSLEREPILRAVSPENTALILGRPPGSILAKQQTALQAMIAKVRADIKSEKNSRLVFGIGCIPMILIGIGLGIIQRGGHLLGAFGASCVPAAVLAAAVISGKRLTETITAHGPSGVPVMWGGLAFLILLTLLIYRKLLRA